MDHAIRIPEMGVSKVPLTFSGNDIIHLCSLQLYGPSN